MELINDILHEQLKQLRGLSKSELVKSEPEQVTEISLAMVEIAKVIIQHRALQGFCEPL